MQTMSSSSISLNTLPRYLPLIEDSNKSRFNQLPNLVDILKNSQLAVAHESTIKAQLAFTNKVVSNNAAGLIDMVEGNKSKPKDFSTKMDSFKKQLASTNSSTEGVVTLGAKEEAGNVSDRVKEYLAKFDAFMTKMESELSTEALSKLFLSDRTAFNQAKETFVTQNAALVKEGEQWLKLIQELISNYKGKNKKSQENRRTLQDQVLHALNILPLQVQLTEALFTQISTFKTHIIAKQVFHARMVQFSDEIRAIYNSNEPADFASLEGKKDEYLATYQQFIKNTHANRENLSEIQRSTPEIPGRQAITTHLNSLILNDPEMEAKTRNQSQEILLKIVKIYEDSRNELETAQGKAETHINSLLKHRIDRLLNGIDWKDFSRTTWKTSILNWTRYSDKAN